ncbi:hypothetical protein CPB83DRAFT_898875 [Crepidotus variabilis]|uniref:F-box domain-containing protein n=1 Tax=Crepidotus variabilis TaxID=179855 RepID=A0A9P6E678_9AGAR|nr:hypothetical protein CPB83DRAFT_898875 [Crepidotus variabilis]
MDNLPPELWYHITRFISSSELWKLRRINHFFQEAAYDRRFKVVTVHIGDLEKMALKGDPFYLTLRARELHFQYGGLHGDRTQASARTPFSTSIAACLKMASKIQDHLLRRHISDEVVNSSSLQAGAGAINASQILTSFKNVQQVFVHGIGNEATRADLEASQLDMLSFAIRSYGMNLTTLSLQIPRQEHFLQVLTSLSTLPRLPHLKRVYLTLYPSSFGDNANFQSEMKYAVVPFLNTHRETLTSLHLLANSYIRGLDLSFLPFLARMPHLRILKLYLLLCLPSAAQTVKTLLKKHTYRLESLVLGVVGPDDIDHQYTNLSLLYTPLPFLKHIEINEDIRIARSRAANSLPALISYISSYRKTLHTLRVSGRKIIYTDMERLASATWPKLVSLDLHLLTCSPEFFDDLAQGFPALQDLSLLVYSFLGSTVPSGALSDDENRAEAIQHPVGRPLLPLLRSQSDCY